MNSACMFAVGEVRLEVVEKGPGGATLFPTRINCKVLYQDADYKREQAKRLQPLGIGCFAYYHINSKEQDYTGHDT